MRTIHIILSFVTVGVLAASCARKNDRIVPRDPAIGTKADSGKNALKITPRHHFDNIDNGMVYIKYNTLNRPFVYDDSEQVRIIDGRPMVIFDSLTPGDFYIFAKGRDTKLDSLVEGGAGFSVLQSYDSIGTPIGRVYEVYVDVTENAPHRF